MPTYTISQFKARASQILQSLEDGDEVIITLRGKPCAKLTAVPEPEKKAPKLTSLMGAYASPDTPDWDYVELESHIREIRDMWKSSVYSIEEENAE